MVFLCLSGIPQDSARVVAQDNQSLSQDEQREFRTGLPKHIPLKIHAKNVNSKKWANDLEIEVTNTSNRPIYYFDLILHLQGVKNSLGIEMVFWLRYGRSKLIDFSTPLEPGDTT